MNTYRDFSMTNCSITIASTTCLLFLLMNDEYKCTKIITSVWRQHILASNNFAVISPVSKCLILFKDLSFWLKEKLSINYKYVIMKYLILLKPQSPLECYMLRSKTNISQVQILMGLLNILVFFII